ncbi:HDOD domain-containing protein [Zoogloea sp.]|uniref:HDOD domain-containing protein n=1 Tax=Zoogloea sp. TaxID=49181 RepID=UPI001415E998|nr:MAG: HDOD domain-containing protein [Zoogloea sp.]
MSTPQELVACVERLASLPAVYHRIRALLDDPDSSVQDLANAVSSDAGITARVLRAVNSVLYGFPGKVETIGRAVNLMGMQQVHDLVLSTSVIGAFSGVRPARMHMIKFWKDCVFRGLAARAAARTLGTGDPERMFVEGLLADIGHLVMFQAAPEATDAALAAARETRAPIHELEQEIVGCNYAEVGAALANAWHLPNGFAAAIGAQIRPALGGPHVTEAALIHIANQILVTAEEAEPDAAALALLDPMVAARMELDTDKLARIRSIAEDEQGSVIALFFPAQG